jgi:hypothetical protein
MATEAITSNTPKNEFPEIPAGRLNVTAAYLFEYWADKGVIPRYEAVIDGLRNVASETFNIQVGR